ncbi:uncharacterized protein MONBRDRAFT_37312 [Monosiga brevicollis MX1]|uniref:Adenylyl cyclase-associated protein n=1 Tax=Monosiga brevicollis TaxID=81824 RepID=A9V0Y7_MONBE|nr:uncharacterized protein MONBRDRAFT_37312 [Monosiga brevicollis MX1]EDQ88715.1 predicted protein [Monosiga brevicollis MX1]|eukprot:XP_001746328.1 hypothetical protein [Monosiga brevicollis MX1]
MAATTAAAAAARTYDVIVYGATGFTGFLVAEYLAERYAGQITWAVAGRNKTKLEEVRSKLVTANPSKRDHLAQLPILVADSSDGAALHAIARQTRVLLSTVGPFWKFGSQVVEACATEGTDYVDITGEIPWVAIMKQQYQEAAVKSGAKIVSLCGFDSIPSDLGTMRAVEAYRAAHAGANPQRVDTFVTKLKGGVSGGTAQSFINMFERSSDEFAQMRKAIGSPYAMVDPEDRPKQRQPDVGEAGVTTIKVTGNKDPGYGMTARMVAESALCLARDRATLPDRAGFLTTAFLCYDLFCTISTMSSDLASLVARLEKVADRLEQSGGASAAKSASAPAASAGNAGGDSGTPSLDAFDEIVNGSVASFVAQGKAIGGDVATIVDKVEQAFAAQRAFLEVATKAKQPDQVQLGSLLKPTSGVITDIVQFREGNRRSPQFDHLSAVSEGIPALGWVTIAPKPAPYVKEMSDAANFYVIRVLKNFKDSDPKQAEWAKTWLAALGELQQFVKQYHTTGLVWNPNGVDASSVQGAAAPAKPTQAAAAPAPSKPAPAAAPGSDARGGLFAELSKGGAITSGLKKVEKSQMTHKNPALRASSVVTETEKKPAAAPAKKYGAAAAAPKEPVFELAGKKWVIEHQRGNHNLVIDDCNNKQTAYIYKCEDCTIQIKGKINSISVDGCKKIGIVFDTVVAAFEVVNTQRVQIQVTGKVATISIDKTDGAQVYLSKDSLDAQIVTAKSSELNVSVPKDDGDFVEFPLPEQYKSVYDGSKFVTEATDIAG